MDSETFKHVHIQKEVYFSSFLNGFMDAKVTRSGSFSFLPAVVIDDTSWQENNF